MVETETNDSISNIDGTPFLDRPVISEFDQFKVGGLYACIHGTRANIFRIDRIDKGTRPTNPFSIDITYGGDMKAGCFTKYYLTQYPVREVTKSEFELGKITSKGVDYQF